MGPQGCSSGGNVLTRHPSEDELKPINKLIDEREELVLEIQKIDISLSRLNTELSMHNSIKA